MQPQHVSRAGNSEPPAQVRPAAGSTRSLTCSARCRGLPSRREECPRRSERVRCRLRGEVPQSCREDNRRHAPTAGLLRLPGRALGPPAHDQPDRVTFATVRQRTKVTKGPGSRTAGLAHGIQAHRVSPGPLAHGQRAASRRPWSAPERPSRTENSSNDPARRSNSKLLIRS
jgi:hypothetical protein